MGLKAKREAERDWIAVVLEPLKSWFTPKLDSAKGDIGDAEYLLRRAPEEWRNFAKKNPALDTAWADESYEVCTSSDPIPQPLWDECAEVLKVMDELPLTAEQRQILDQHTAGRSYLEIGEELHLPAAEVLRQITSILSSVHTKMLQSRTSTRGGP